MSKIVGGVKRFAGIGFVLLGILFGMVIMSFIFGQLGNSNTIADETDTVLNQGGAFFNSTIFTIAEKSNANFSGSFIVTQAMNTTSSEIILPGNYTVDASAGTVVNTTTLEWDAVTLNYTFKAKTNLKLSSEEVQGNSLQGIVSYTSQSVTQFRTLGIAITLIILIGVFLLFWRVFVTDKNNKKSGGSFA